MDKKIELTPSYLGKKCLGNNLTLGECLCDGCKYCYNCFPGDPNDPYKFGDARDFWRPQIREETCFECKYLIKFKEPRHKKHYCVITKRIGSSLRGLRCLHFDKLEEK